MKLTSHYQRIAIFDSPVEVTHSYSSEKRGRQTEFRRFSLPPFEYEISFRRVIEGNYLVAFSLVQIHASGQELADLLSRVFHRRIPVDQAENWRTKINPTGILNTGNAGQVLGTVVRVIREFVSQNRVHCLMFSSIEKSRTDLYRRMVRSIARDAAIEEDEYGFQICFPENER